MSKSGVREGFTKWDWKVAVQDGNTTCDWCGGPISEDTAVYTGEKDNRFLCNYCWEVEQEVQIKIQNA